MEHSELVEVYTCNASYQGEIIKNALNDEGIRCFLENANQAGEAGLIGIPIRLLVPAADADRARKLIQSHEPHPEEQD